MVWRVLADGRRGCGNPSPPGAFGPPLASTRLGDNLYSASVVALDADTGALKWHYQFTPHDDMDWDAAQVPVLADIRWQGRPRKVMVFASAGNSTLPYRRTTRFWPSRSGDKRDDPACGSLARELHD